MAQAIIIAEAAERGPLDADDLGRRFWNWAETNGLGMGGLTSDVLELYGGDLPQFLGARGMSGSAREPSGMPIVQASETAWSGLRAGNGAAMRCTPIAIRWRDDPLPLVRNSVVSALVDAEPRFRRVRGYRDVQYLVGALDALAPPDDVVAEVA